MAPFAWKSWAQLEKCYHNFLDRETKAQYCWWAPIWLESFSVIVRHTVIPTIFYHSLNIKSISWPDGLPLITESHYRRSLLDMFESADRAQIWEHLQYWSARQTKASTDSQHLRQRLFHWKQYFNERQKKQLSVCIKHEQPALTGKQYSRILLQKQALTDFDSASITDIC